MTEHKPWLSLPDEEPPERGLAELMAAARMKAEVMAAPPWWKRLFAMMRRPPVLALATVMILVCGVIVVGRHHDQAAAPAPAIDVPAGHLDVRTRGAAAEPPPPPERHPEKQVEQPIDLQIEQPIEQAPVEEKAVGGHAPTANRLEADDQPLDTTSPKTETIDTSPRKADVVHGEMTKAGLNKPADPLARCRAAAARRDCAAAKACVKDTGLAVGDDATLKSCL